MSNFHKKLQNKLRSKYEIRGILSFSLVNLLFAARSVHLSTTSFNAGHAFELSMRL